MIVKITILRLLGSSGDKEKEKIGVSRPEGPPLRGFRPSRVSGQRPVSSSVQRTRIEETVKKTKSKKSRQRQFTITDLTDDREIVLTGATDSEKAKSAEYTG